MISRIIFLVIVFLFGSDALALTDVEADENNAVLMAYIHDLIKYSVTMLCVMQGMRFGQELNKI